MPLVQHAPVQPVHAAHKDEAEQARRHAGCEQRRNFQLRDEPMASEDPPSPKARKGFAAMSPEMQREIASKGGKAAHQSGNAHEFSSDEARKAGRKGGLARAKNRRGRR